MLVIGLGRQELETSARRAKHVWIRWEPVFYRQQKARSHASWHQLEALPLSRSAPLTDDLVGLPLFLVGPLEGARVMLQQSFS